MDTQKLSELAEEFAQEMRISEELKSHVAEHERRSERSQAMLTQERIPTLGENDLRELFYDTDAFSFWRDKDWEFNKRLENVGLDGLRNVLHELMMRAKRGLGSEDLKQVWQMKGLGRLLTTELLTYRFPDRYWTYNERVTLLAFSALGEDVKASMPRGRKSDPYIYLALAPLVEQVRNALAHVGLSDVNNLLVDIFLWWVKEHFEADHLGKDDSMNTEKTPTNIWMLQANEKYMSAKLNSAQVGDKSIWAIRSTKPRSSDLVVLWQNGPNAGIRAVARLLNDPYTRSAEADDEDIEERLYPKQNLRVDLQYICILSNSITRRYLETHEVLKRLRVLETYHPEAYAITEKEWEAIKMLIDQNDESPKAYPIREFDRNSEEQAKRLFERIFPDPETRKGCLEFLADSIIYAHEYNPSGWMVSLLEREVRLSVGRIEVIDFRPSRIDVDLEIDALVPNNRELLGDRLSPWDKYGRSMPQKPWTARFTADESQVSCRW